MSRDHSADPFSTFLNATIHQSSTGIGNASSARNHSTDPLPPAPTQVLRALHGERRVPVGDLRVELGLTTLQIAEAVSLLSRLDLVRVVPADTDEVVVITAAGEDLIESMT